MRKLYVVGIGAGDPDYLTIQAVKALNALDVVFIPDKGQEKEELRLRRLAICERFIEHRAYRTVAVELPKRDRAAAYEKGVDAWHAAIQARYEALVWEHLGETDRGGFLVWGDPTLYDSTLRILERMRAKGLAFDYDVIPGISAVQALAARHRVALNEIGAPVTIVPARRLDDRALDDAGSAVVVLDGERAYRRIAGEDIDIFWGAYLGTQDECLVSGRLSEVADEIDALREDRRRAKGWIMDSYLLRRRR